MNAEHRVHFAEILLPFALAGSFTYKIPMHLIPSISIGERVVVPFGKNKFFSGILIKIHHDQPTGFEVKEIVSVLDENPVITEKQLLFWEWIAHYYLCSLGEVMKASLPSALKLESETIILPEANFTEYGNLSVEEQIVFNAVQLHKRLTIEKIRILLDKKSVLPILNTLFLKQAIFLDEDIHEKYKPKYTSYLVLADEYIEETALESVAEKLKKMKQQYKVLMLYLELSGFNGKQVCKKTITENLKNAPSAITALVKKGILIEIKQEVGRIQENCFPDAKEILLNKFQQIALDEIITGFKIHETALLHGVTSSGKTEIYIELIKKIIEQNRQVLYLLPEIALTTQITSRLSLFFGEKLGIYHSKFNDSERVEIWNNILNNKYQVILGVRSAILLPFKNLGLIIIDEEHEVSYKQIDPAPRYHARDAAIMLAKIHDAKTLLGSATPSVETWYNAQIGKYAYIKITKRFNEIALPKVIVMDMKTIYFKKHMMSDFSPYLIDRIKEALAKDEQIILFQNRRGFSPYLECAECGWIPKCKQCNVSLTYHKFLNKLSCHYCGYTINTVTTCNDCKCNKIQTKGFGTEKIEEELKIYFPTAKVARMDLDTAKTRKDYERIIHGFEDKKIDILIGTQMVAKGLNFDNVSLVGVLNADNMLNFPDFRAFERSFQLLVQVSGRAGRTGKQGIVIVQTSDPNHPIIKDFFYNDVSNFFTKQLDERKMYNYPPFTRLIKLTLKHRKDDVVNACANDLIKELKLSFEQNVLGPETPLVNKIQNYFIRNILIKLTKDKNLNTVKIKILNLISCVIKKEAFRHVIIIKDVDPA